MISRLQTLLSTASRATTAWLKKGVVMSETIVLPPTVAASPTRAGTRKRNAATKAAGGEGAEARAGEGAKSPTKKARKKKAGGPTREHEQARSNRGHHHTISPLFYSNLSTTTLEGGCPIT